MLHALPIVLVQASSLPWSHDPVSGPEDESTRAVREDWENFVRPDLRDHCENEVMIFHEDVAAAEADTMEPILVPDASGGPGTDDRLYFPEDEGPYSRITIPAAHVEPWYGALNQARLAIESVHSFEGKLPGLAELQQWEPARQAAYWHSKFYGSIQQVLLDCMEARFESQE